MNYLVKNIKFEKDQYKTQMPIEFGGCSWLGKTYLRSELFQINDLTYTVEPIKDYFHHTHTLAPQPYFLDILNSYTEESTKFVTADVAISYRNSVVLFISDEELKDYGSLELKQQNPLALAVFDQLTNFLDVDFMYTES